jgi:hypothetical protein
MATTIFVRKHAQKARPDGPHAPAAKKAPFVCSGSSNDTRPEKPPPPISNVSNRRCSMARILKSVPFPFIFVNFYLYLT